MYIFKNQLKANYWSVFNNTKIGWTLLNDYNGFFSGTNLDNRHLLSPFLIGTFLLIPGWILSRFERFRWLNKLHCSLILVRVGWMSSIVPSDGLFPWLVIGLSVYLTFVKSSCRQCHVYFVSSALHFGLNLTIVIVNIALKNNNIFFSQWWKNENGIICDSCQRAVQTW
jgi:hypothetical protein